MRDAGSAAAPAARCRNCRRGSFITVPPFGASSLNDLVGAGEQRRWHGEAERFGSDQVDNQIELGRLFNRKVGGFCSAQNLVDIVASAPVQVRVVWAI